jgi:hypothetical protein
MPPDLLGQFNGDEQSHGVTFSGIGNRCNATACLTVQRSLTRPEI